MKLKNLFQSWVSPSRSRAPSVSISQDESPLRSERRRLRGLRDSRRRSAPPEVSLRVATGGPDPEPAGVLLFVSPSVGYNERPIDCPDRCPNGPARGRSSSQPHSASRLKVRMEAASSGSDASGHHERKGPAMWRSSLPRAKRDALGSKEEFRKDFASGLWSISPVRLHLNDAATNTSREESGYATSSPPSSVSPAEAPPSTAEQSSSSDPPNYPPPPPPPLSPSPDALEEDGQTAYERLACRDEQTAVFNSFFRMAEPEVADHFAHCQVAPLPSPSKPRKLPPPDLIREDISISSLYDRIGLLAGMVRNARSSSDWAATRAAEEELEELYARLPTLPLPPIDPPPPKATHTTPRQKKRERRLSRAAGEGEWADDAFDYVVSLDVGTSFTRAAFAVKGDPDVHVVTSEDGEEASGVPSCLLLCPDGRFHSFGAAARRRFRDLGPQDAKRHLYFENFKANIVLRGFQEPGLESCIQAASGRFVPAVDVFAHLLRHLRHAALRALARHTAALQEPLFTNATLKPPDPGKVQWVLLVPFFWSQEAKNFMREAAYLVSCSFPSNESTCVVNAFGPGKMRC